MTEHLLILNAGSSSLKFALYAVDGLALAARGEVESIGRAARLTIRFAGGATQMQPTPKARDHESALRLALAALRGAGGEAPVAVGHRVVHGGRDFVAPLLVDEGVLGALEKLAPLAPLHQPHNIAGLRAARALFPRAAQVACFDTAFHSGQSFAAQAYGLPRAMFEAGLRRYGFHGLSYDYVSRRLAEIAPEAARGRVVIAHLGNGASLCGLDAGRSVASTMGFSTLDGLPMGTRCGQIDPGVLLYLMQSEGYDAAALTDLLYRRSGLAGLSQVSNDWREIAASPTSAARDAVAYFVARIVHEAGALAASLGGLDALVFTGGIGEHAAPLRAAVAARLAWLGAEIDEEANALHGPLISTPSARLALYVVPTDEERRIAELTLEAAKAVASM